MAGSIFQDRKVLIAGGLGFIGSTLARRLVDVGADVTVVDSLVPIHGGNLANIRGIENQVRVEISDMRCAKELPALNGDLDFVFNLAGQSSHLDSMTDPLGDLEVNCAAQIAFLEVVRRQCPGAKIVFASTRQIYGRPDYLPVDEQHPIRPVDVNGVHKAAAEAYHLLYGRVYGMRTVVLRLTNTYGPRMRARDARQTFLGVWISHALQGLPFEVWGGEQLRDFSYVDDVVEAMLLAAVEPSVEGGAFNLSGAPVVSLRELAIMLAEATQGAFELRAFPPERLRIDIGDYYADDRRFRSLTGWEPKVALQEGLQRTLSYYREHLPDYL